MLEPYETTSTQTVTYLGVWTNMVDDKAWEDALRKLRDMPSEFPDLPCEEDEDL
jgi:hypothetical protein